MNKTTDSIHAACTAQTTLATPLGPMLLARTADGLAGAWFAGQKHHPAPFTAMRRPDDALLRRAAEQLLAYFAGAPATFDDVPLDLNGTAFQRSVWAALRRVPAGRTATYGEIARSLGAPAAVRAVGGAIGRNPLSVIVPCLRVVGTAGSMTGYAGGVDR